jgi:transposase
MAKRTYSPDFKAAAAKLVTEQGRGTNDVANSPGVAPGTLPYRARRFGTKAAARPRAPDDHAGPPREDERLRREDERPLMGREILRGATASFAGEQARDSPSSAATATSPRWR